MPPKKSKKSKKVLKPPRLADLAELIVEAPPSPPSLPDNFEKEYMSWWDENLYKDAEEVAASPKKKKNKKKKAKIYLAPPSSQGMLDQVVFDMSTAWKGDVVLAYDSMTSPSNKDNCPFCHQTMEKTYFWTVLAAAFQWILMPLSFFSLWGREKGD